MHTEKPEVFRQSWIQRKTKKLLITTHKSFSSLQPRGYCFNATRSHKEKDSPLSHRKSLQVAEDTVDTEPGGDPLASLGLASKRHRWFGIETPWLGGTQQVPL